jgi:hypothetical protein
MKPGILRDRPWLFLLAGALFLTLVALVAPGLPVDATLKPSEVRVIAPHSLDWSAADGTVRSGRDDPHFELVLPWWARATPELTLVVEPIWGNVGVFQFFYIPTGSQELYFNEEMSVRVDAKIYGGPYLLKAKFPSPVARVRLDPPDGASFILQSVIVQAYPGRIPIIREIVGWLAVVFWVATLAVRFQAQGRAGLHWMSQRPRPVVLVILALVTLARIWLTATQPLKAVGGAIHDDQLFIDQAASIVSGHWLGGYNNLTLIKGQGYPLWIAAMYLLHIPLVFSQHLLYAAAAALAYAAWRPALPRLWRLIVVIVVLFNPASFHGDDAARVLRNHFSASLALLTFMCVTGWFLRLRRKARAQIGWAAGGGAAFSVLWLTREETVWMTGVVALLALAGAWLLRRDGARAWRRVALVALVPAGLGVIAVTTICALNYSHYRFWGTVEFRAAPYKDAYGALARINVGPWRQYVPVSREMREAAYRVSPAFAKMQPFLEGKLGEGWASLGTSTTGLPASERQIHGAAFMWALRDGAAAAGEHASCELAMVYYRRLADEINAACDDGRLPALGRRSGFVPPWRREYTEQLPGTYFESWKFITTFIYVVPKPPPSSGPDNLLKAFRDMTRTTLSPRPEDAPLPAAGRDREAFKNGVLKDITRIYSWITPFAVLAALPLLGWLWLRVIRRGAGYETVVVATAALAGAVAITLIVTLVHVTSFVAITIGYQASAYPLVLIFASLSIIAAAHALLRPDAPPVN